MADDFHVEIRGVAEFNQGLDKLAANIEDAAPKELARVADRIADDVRGDVPKRTGALAGSVTSKQTARGATLSMGEGVPYARFVEYGGRGFPRSAQGNYFGPAVEDAGPRVHDAGEKVARDEIGRMVWPSPT